VENKEGRYPLSRTDEKIYEKRETTDTILTHLRNNAPDNLVAHVGNIRYLVPTIALKALAWNSVPDFIKDADSEEAKKNQTLRTGLKALIRPFLPDIIKKSWGRDVKIVPRMNILNWLPQYLIHILVNAVSTMEWKIDVEKCESCEGTVFKVVGISPYTHPIIHSESLPTARADYQSIQGRREPDSSRAADSNEPRGPVGYSGRPPFREVNIFERTPNGA
jgi:hypothetical protein